MTKIDQILFMGTRWPQFQSSAASVRTINLLSCLNQTFKPKKIVMCSPQSLANETLIDNLYKIFTNLQIFTQPINQPIEDGRIRNPQIAVFDTFISEEYYGREIYHKFPNCITICDTQDIRSLRFLRESMVMDMPIANIINHTFETIIPTINYKKRKLIFSQEFKDAFPAPNDELLLRELSSIWRSNLSLIVSSREMELLNTICNVPSEKMLLAPFIFTNTPDISVAKRPFNRRKNFIHIGSFRHPPNRDAVLMLKYYLWPRIRSKIGNAELHVYGSNMSDDFIRLEDKRTGLLMKKLLPSVEHMEKYRVNLAPLRFGAGIKGKIEDGWKQHTPCVTTWIGAEGMTNEPKFPFSGVVAENSWDEFVDGCIRLYTDEKFWNTQYKNAHLMCTSSDAPLSDTTSQTLLEQAMLKLLDNSHKQDYMTLVMRRTSERYDFKSKYLQAKEKLDKLIKNDNVQDQENPIVPIIF
jgi:hypothetical protein